MLSSLNQYQNRLKTNYKNIHRELVDLCRKGDRKAQFRLYELYYKPMYNVSLRIVNNETEAEDVMQEAFLKAFRKINSYKGEVSFGAWLKKIVINHSLDCLKKRKVQFEEISENEMVLLEEQEQSEKVDTERIKQAIRSLSDNYRTVLTLFLFEGYDHEEISTILKISYTASRTQLSRAKQKLREILKKEEIRMYD